MFFMCYSATSGRSEFCLIVKSLTSYDEPETLHPQNAQPVSLMLTAYKG